MYYVLLMLVVLSYRVFGAYEEGHDNVPKPEAEHLKVVEAELNPKYYLSEDEVEFVHNQFKTAVIQGAQYQCVQAISSLDGKFFKEIKHPKDNPVVKLISTKLWKSQEEMENEIYENIYKISDKEHNGFRVWNYEAELSFVGNKILDKVNKDNEFFLELVKLVKEQLKKK